MSRSRRQLSYLAIAAAIALGTSSCAERVIYRDQRIPEVPAAAAGFLGYQSATTNQTVCGNCHVGHQSDWERTAHAESWVSLAGSAGKQAFCEGCHTVGQRGNASPDSTGGWIGTKDTRYHDVQCESCHGPGLPHVQNPESTQPLAPIAVGADLSVGCGECHNGTHHPFVEEWQESGHGAPLASPASRPECQSCHTAKGALDAWGVTADYKEKNNTEGHKLGIVCAVCHDPHSNEASRRSETGAGPTNSLSMPASGGQLRYSVDVPNEEQNLCMKCHHKRGVPDLGTTQNSRGPHSPEGPLLLGENVGFWFSDTPTDVGQIAGTHGTEGNPRLCATCHMVRYEVTDKATGAFKFQSVGHRFEAIPCVNSEGVPTGEDTCTITARSFRGCLGSGCHQTETAARSAFTVVNTRVATLAAELKRLIDQVRATEIKSTDNRWSSAEGADFNYQLAMMKGSPTHNPFMVEALLTASIQEMKRRYGLQVNATIDLRNTLSAAHGATGGNE